MPATPSPSTEPASGQGSSRPQRHVLPRTFQWRLTLGFVGVTALTVALISVAVVVRLDAYFQEQDQQYLTSRSQSVASVVSFRIAQASGVAPVVDAANVVNEAVVAELDQAFLDAVADRIALADVVIRLGSIDPGDTTGIDVAPNGTFKGTLDPTVEPAGQTREPGGFTSPVYVSANSAGFRYAIQIALLEPLTFRATTINNVIGLLVVFGALGLTIAVIVAALLALRFATPLRRLAQTAKHVGEGDLSSRVPLEEASAGSAEIGEVSHQFNAMADRLEESIEIIRRDRDRSREFLADVSHELKTPITSMRTFLELLQGPAGADGEHRQEFLSSSLSQLGRLDWMAENLLELSKLDSGLVALDLRPEDLRGTVESAIEQAASAADRRGVRLSLEVPDQPLRVFHDPVRIGQVVANLVANGIKFTPRGGTVAVVVRSTADGAVIEVRDSGIGIGPDELPHVFERFYRGVGAAEARSEGSGLGLAIVKSITDMHGGRVSVESRVGVGSTFRVDLPRDARTASLATAPEADQTVAPGGRDATPDGAAVLPLPADDGQMMEPSPNADPRLNPRGSP